MQTNHRPEDGAPLEEGKWRYARIEAAMEQHGLEHLVLLGPSWRRENVRYACGVELRSTFSAVYLPRSGTPRAFVSDPRDIDAVRAAGWVPDVRLWSDQPTTDLAESIKPNGGQGLIGIAHLELGPHGVLEGLLDAAAEGQVVSATALLDRIRLAKSDWEVTQVRAAARLADIGWEAFVEAAHAGAREFEVVAAVEATLKAQGAEDNFMLIASGGNDVRGMTPPSEREIRAGDLVRTELTPRVNGYYAQICRTVSVGEPNKAAIDTFDLFHRAMLAGLGQVRPGATGHDIAQAENDVFRSVGWGQYCTAEYTRVRGHGYGLHPDERPTLLEGNEDRVEANTTLIVHPNTFSPDAGYMVFGDAVLVTEEGYEPLLATDRQLFVTEA